MPDRFKYPVEDTTEEVEDDMEYFVDDSWMDYEEEEEYDEESVGFVEDLEHRLDESTDE